MPYIHVSYSALFLPSTIVLYFSKDVVKTLPISYFDSNFLEICAVSVGIGAINKKPALGQITAWCLKDDKPLSGLLVYIYSLLNKTLSELLVYSFCASLDLDELKNWCDISVSSFHYYDVIMNAMASQNTSVSVVYSTVVSDADQRKHQSSASLAFARGIHRWPVNSPHKRPVTRKMFPFDDVIMSLRLVCFVQRGANIGCVKLKVDCTTDLFIGIVWDAIHTVVIVDDIL